MISSELPRHLHPQMHIDSSPFIKSTTGKMDLSSKKIKKVYQTNSPTTRK